MLGPIFVRHEVPVVHEITVGKVKAPKGSV